MNPQKRKYHVILVHYGDEQITTTAIQKLVTAKKKPNTLTVIDHAKTPFPDHQSATIVIRPSANRGYAAGINIGLGALVAHQADEQDNVICMNNDVYVYPDTLEQLHAWWRQHPQDALVGTDQHYINLSTGRTSTEPTGMPYIDGAFFSAPYRVFLQLKGLPEDYFMYWEDVLFSIRAKQAGLPLKVAKTVQVSHADPSRLPASHHTYYLVRNGARFLASEAPHPWRWYWQLANRARETYHHLRPDQKSDVINALRDARRGVTGRRP